MAIYFVGFITSCKKSLDYSNAGFSLSFDRLITETLQRIRWTNLNIMILSLVINFGEAYFSLDICKGSIFLHIRENVHKVKDGTDRFM